MEAGYLKLILYDCLVCIPCKHIRPEQANYDAICPGMKLIFPPPLTPQGGGDLPLDIVRISKVKEGFPLLCSTSIYYDRSYSSCWIGKS